MKIKVSAAATLSNFGPGFDTLGMAIDRNLVVTFESNENLNKSELTFEGEYDVPNENENLIFLEIKKNFNKPFKLHFKNDIPLKRGLGSSSAALVITHTILNIIDYFKVRNNFQNIDKKILLEEIKYKIYNKVLSIEGHPDNVTPCIFGGFTTSIFYNNEIKFLHLPFPEFIDIYIIIPDFEIETKMARKILPKSYNISDIVFNLQNLSYMVALFSLYSNKKNEINKFYELKNLLKDRIHQDYRTKLCPAISDVILSLNSSNSIFGAFLSGSGSTICVLANKFDLNVKHEILNAVHIFNAQSINVKLYNHKIEYESLKILDIIY